MFDNWETHMDYSGQKFAEQTFQRIIVCFAVVAFFVGYAAQQLSYSMFVLAAGCFVAGLVTLPPWPMYRRDHIKWQKPREEEDSSSISSQGKRSKPSKKRD